MKTLKFSLLVFNVIFLFNFSQSQNFKKLKQLNENLSSKKISDLHKSKSNPIWSDDFSDPSTWVVDHDASACNLDWEIGTNLSCGGSYQIATILSSTYDNGCAMLDSDEYGGEEGGAEIEDSWMTTASPINLSSNPNIVLQFETWYQSYNSERCFVVTSTNNTDWPELTPNFDASTNSNVYEVFPDLSGTVQANVGDNPTLWRINISPSAANQEQVWIRFHWTGTWGYAWFIDDAAIVEQPADDIELTSSWLMTPNGTEYGRTPSDQVDSLILGGNIYNFGYADQSNVNISALVTLNGNTVMESSSLNQALLESDSSVSLNEVFTNQNLSTGTYDLSFAATSDNESADGVNYFNNTFSRTMEITNNLFSMDGIDVYSDDISNLTSTGTNSFTDDPDGLVLMTWYEITEETDLVGFEVLLQNTSTTTFTPGPGGTIYPFLMDFDTWNVEPTAIDIFDRYVENTDGVEITSADISAGMVWCPMPKTTLSPGIYIACIELFSNSGANHFRVLDDETVVQPASASTIYLPSDAQLYTNGEAYAIRLGLNGYGTAMSTNKINNNNDLSIYPNPSNGVFSVSCENQNINKIEVSNMIGEILFEQNINGILNSKFDLSHLNSGVYFINIYGEKTEITKKVFIK
ncbi:MAG: hypothetical protein CMD07_03680 [Flavobacteriales bacterium]|nr:hypothetical protein [Flavobacteriales bacterium]|tara:strand:- start:1731 stop:3638 length:1908 start_codon:yes stop_codon:yes gene_type:complete